MWVPYKTNFKNLDGLIFRSLLQFKPPAPDKEFFNDTENEKILLCVVVYTIRNINKEQRLCLLGENFLKIEVAQRTEETKSLIQRKGEDTMKAPYDIVLQVPNQAGITRMVHAEPFNCRISNSFRCQ